MIEYIRGELAEITPAYAVVEAGGVGYGVHISLNTFTAIQREKQVKLYVFESIREDAHELFGFARREEREMFEMLIGVSGIGSNTARVILSEMTVENIAQVITSGDERTLKGVKGIGLKTAQRIIVELKDKAWELVQSAECRVQSASEVQSAERGVQSASAQPNSALCTLHSAQKDAVGALTMLGFQAAISNKVVIAILKEQPELPVEQVVKLALKRIK